MEKKRKTLLHTELLFLVILISGLLVLTGCDQPGSVVDSSVQDKTVTEENSATPVYFYDDVVTFEDDSDDSVENSGQEDDGKITSTEIIEDEKPNIIRVEIVEDESDEVIGVSLVQISEIKLSPQSGSVGYNGKINITAQVSPEGAGFSKLKWNLKYADGSEVGANDDVWLIDNGDGTCTLVHEKVSSYRFNVVVTAYTDNGVSDSCTIECRKGGWGILDYATDGFIKEEDYDVLP